MLSTKLHYEGATAYPMHPKYKDSDEFQPSFFGPSKRVKKFIQSNQKILDGIYGVKPFRKCGATIDQPKTFIDLEAPTAQMDHLVKMSPTATRVRNIFALLIGIPLIHTVGTAAMLVYRTLKFLTFYDVFFPKEDAPTYKIVRASYALYEIAQTALSYLALYKAAAIAIFTPDEGRALYHRNRNQIYGGWTYDLFTKYGRASVIPHDVQVELISRALLQRAEKLDPKS
ncbi:MAG: hypothetical protein MRY21_08315 [Simkaniaceae bacterium]|nr:hypothetical protein [Simkaniaceae bacterium]